MPTPRMGYKVKVEWDKVAKSLRLVMRQIEQGTLLKVPSTTTITGRYKDSGALTYWANQEGLAGRPLRGEGSKLEEAATIGTMIHNFVECDIRALPLPQLSFTEYSDEFIRSVDSGFEAYLKFKQLTNLKPFHTELQLTSAEWLFGGTLDAVQIQGETALLDWKSSNGIYADHIYQLCGYAILWSEAYPDLPLSGYHILRFSKQDGDMTHHAWKNLDLGIEAFKHMRILYEIDQQMKARL